MFRRMAGVLLDVVYPRFCDGCGNFMDSSGCLCWDCLCASDKVQRPFCERCGDPVDGVVEGSYQCSWCLKHRPEFEAARSIFRYRGPVASLVQEYKYRGGVYLGPDIAAYMTAAVKSSFSAIRFDLVIGVPLYPRKERERGYNQAGILAECIGRGLKVECFNRGVRRIRDTGSQIQLKAARRSANVKGAFSVTNSRWIFGKHILLVDDVMTTGATSGELSGALKQAGAASIYVITFARG